MAPAGHPMWGHLAFRDHLRSHTDEAREYERLKRQLASTYPEDRAAYTEGKGDFIERVTAEALAQRGPLPRADIRFTSRRLTAPLSPDSDLVAALVRLWREARASHLQFLTDLHSADEDRAYLSGVVLPANEVWVAEIDNQLAGFIAFHDGWVNHLYVAPPFQGRGIGSELVAIARRENRTLQLWAFEANEPAIRFYERRGFRVVERTYGESNEAKRPDVRMQWDG